MKSRTNEQGSALHIVIVIVLVVALLGALGFIFYQNFIQQSSSTNKTVPDTTQQTEDEQDVEIYKGMRVSAVSGEYSIKIPNGWAVTRNTDDTSNIQQSVLSDEFTLTYDESKPPVVTDERIGGHDGLIFNIRVQAVEYPTDGSETRTAFTTDSGIVGSRIERFIPSSDEQTMYSNYDLYLYGWIFSKNSGPVVYISWAQALDPGTKRDAAQLQLLDDVARTLEIN